MADIELVIKVPEYFYEYCKAQTDATEIQLAVAKGIPLPTILDATFDYKLKNYVFFDRESE